jgi:purine-binding chemotaxis protein CheW
MTQLVHQDTFGIGVSESIKSKLYATFYLGGEVFAVDALQVQEIVLFQKMTPVPHAPAYILGLINLRGQIVTALDLRYRLSGESITLSDNNMNVILKTPAGVCSVLVEDVGDVLEIEEARMESVPETMSVRMRDYVSKICKMDDSLLCILDIDRIVKQEA